MFWTLVIFVIFAAWFSYRRQKSSRLRSLAEKIPGPKALPILGNVLEFGVKPTEFVGNLNRVCREYGPTMRLWMGSKLYVVLQDHNDVEIILSNVKYIEKSTDYEFQVPWLGRGLITSSGDKWRKHRKLLTPTFHFKILEQFIEVFNRNAEVLVDKMSGEVGTPAFDIYRYVTLCALDIICETAMGVKIDAQQGDSEYIQALKDMCDVIVKRSFRPLLRSEWVFPFTKQGKLQAKSLPILHGMTNKVIQQRKLDLQAASQKEFLENVEAKESVTTKTRLAFLDLLIHYSENGSILSDEEIREEVDTFMFAGHDTTTSAISFTLWLLANHRQEQDKAYRELEEIFDDDSRSPTLKDLQRMKYLEAIIKESLRLYPSVPFYTREMQQDVPITNGYVLPKGSSVLVLTYKMHLNPLHFPEPTIFRPDRFLSENSTGRHPFSYVPFSAGPRNCIGQKFAMLEMKTLISTVLRRYRLHDGMDAKKLKLTNLLILKSNNGLHLKISPRSKEFHSRSYDDTISLGL